MKKGRLPTKQGIDYVGVGVGAVIFNKKGQVFLSLRGKQARNEAGKWEFPGGAVEFGDTIESTVIREIKEEYGIDIKPIEILDVVNNIFYPMKNNIGLQFLTYVRL